MGRKDSVIVGVNAGSGQRPFKSIENVIDWINIDKVARPDMPRPDVICDASKLPTDDECLDYFVLHHVLEHFGCGEGDDVLREAYRVLKPGGSLLVFVPDLRALAQRWIQGGLSTQVYVTNLYGAYMVHEEDRHRWGFDWKLLRDTLANAAPWRDVIGFDWRPIPGSDIARDFWILGMECIK